MKRREFIKGLSLTTILAVNPAIIAAERRRRGHQFKHFVFVNLKGAPSQFELFDPKPGHANGGDTKTVKTKIADVIFAEYLSNMADISDKMAVLRMTSKEPANHSTGQKKILSGGFAPDDFSKRPAMGALAAFAINDAGNGLPDFISIGDSAPLNGGFLGKKFEAFSHSDSSMFNVPDETMAKVEASLDLRKKLADLSPYKDHEAFQQDESLHSLRAGHQGPGQVHEGPLEVLPAPDRRPAGGHRVHPLAGQPPEVLPAAGEVLPLPSPRSIK